MTRSKIKISHTRSFEPDRNGPKSIFLRISPSPSLHTVSRFVFRTRYSTLFLLLWPYRSSHTIPSESSLHTRFFRLPNPTDTPRYSYLQQQSVVVSISCPPPLTHVQQCVLCTDVSERAVWPSVVRGGGASVASAPKSAPKR